MFYGFMKLFSEIKLFLKSFTGAATANGFVLVLSVMTLALIFVSIVMERERFRRLALVSRNSKREKRMSKSPFIYFPPAQSEAEDKRAENEDVFSKTLIDSGKADSLISNKMAKNLVGHAHSVRVFGKKKRSVNIGELSRVFSAGERVDINRMKAVGILPYDTAEVKILGGGVIDKQLFIFANSFSHSAVKMIALMGGKAERVRSIRVKFPKEIDG